MKQKIALVVLMVFFLTSCGVFANPRQPDLATPIMLPTLETETPQRATNTPDCLKIAIVIRDGVTSDIYTVCPDGTDLVNLTKNWTTNYAPAWSPDGTKIAYTSLLSGSSQIYVMNENGMYPMQITTDYMNDHPIWLPDGRRIAFRTTDDKGLWWWRIINLESNEITNFSEPSYDFFFQTPAWSTDGKYLAYMSLVEQQARNDGSSQIHVKKLPNRSDTALTNDVWANINPVWSPDGERIAFFSERDGTYNLFALYVMNDDGSELQRVTEPHYSENASVSWSPDGKWVVVGGNEYPNNKVVIINLKSKEVLEFLDLTADLWASDPDWQPNQ